MNSPHKRDGNYYTERKDYNQFQEDDPNYENYEDLKSKSEFFFFYSLNNNFRIIYCLFPQTLNIFFFFTLASWRCKSASSDCSRNKSEDEGDSEFTKVIENQGGGVAGKGRIQ